MNLSHFLNRRQWLTRSGLGLGMGGLGMGGLGMGATGLGSTGLAGATEPRADVGGAGAAASSATPATTGHSASPAESVVEPAVRFCFNTSCLRGQRLPIETLVPLVAQAGYDGIEVWIDELDRYTEQGGKLTDLGQQIADCGLRVESAIAFANWLEPEEAQATAEFEKARRDMEKVAAIGGRAIAAPPVGQNDRPIADWDFAAERLARLAAVGREVGVVPQLELWGFSQAIGNLSQLLQLAARVEGRDFGVLLDVYHLYKGGSPDSALRLVSGSSMSLFHINDYPATPDRSQIGDKDRVFPGDGVAPLPQLLGDLASSGFQGALSLELFNPDYWQREPLWVLETGLAKSRAAWAARIL